MPNTMSDALNPKFIREVGDGFREKVLLLKPLKERFGEAVLDVVREALEWGYALHCAQDPHIIAGFNPAIGFRQTRWLMRGDDCCDHFYSAARAVRNR
jgi:hypothetical protein